MDVRELKDDGDMRLSCKVCDYPDKLEAKSIARRIAATSVGAYGKPKSGMDDSKRGSESPSRLPKGTRLRFKKEDDHNEQRQV